MARASTAAQHRAPDSPGRDQEARRNPFAMKSPKRIAARLKDMAEHERGQAADPYRSAMGMLTSHMNRAASQIDTEEKARLEKAKDELRNMFQRPSTGRTTALGRRVEKPGTGRQSGPSGQTDSAQHEKKHANK